MSQDAGGAPSSGPPAGGSGQGTGTTPGSATTSSVATSMTGAAEIGSLRPAPTDATTSAAPKFRPLVPSQRRRKKRAGPAQVPAPVAKPVATKRPPRRGGMSAADRARGGASKTTSSFQGPFSQPPVGPASSRSSRYSSSGRGGRGGGRRISQDIDEGGRGGRGSAAVGSAMSAVASNDDGDSVGEDMLRVFSDVSIADPPVHLPRAVPHPEEIRSTQPLLAEDMVVDVAADVQLPPDTAGAALLEAMNDYEERMLFMQLPAFLPCATAQATTTAAYGMAPTPTGAPDAPVMVDLADGPRQQALENDFSGNVTTTPSGYLGKMVVYKSGRVKFKVHEVLFDVQPGVQCSFEQEAVYFEHGEQATDPGHLHFLSTLKRRLVVTPDFEHLLSSSS